MVSTLVTATRKCADTLMSGITDMKDTWLHDESLYRQLRHMYPDLQGNDKFTRASMAKALSGVASNAFDSPSPSNLYTKQFQGTCPYENKKRRINFYYRSTDGTVPKAPAMASDMNDPYARSHSAIEDRRRVSAAERARAHSAETDDALRKVQESDEKKDLKTPRRKKNGEVDKPKATPSPQQKKEEKHDPDLWFDQKSNAKVFGYDPLDIDGRSFLEERIEQLETAIQGGQDAIYSIVDHKGHPLTSYQARRIERRAMFLVVAYKIALDRLGHDISEEDLRDKDRDEKYRLADSRRAPQFYRWKDHCCQPAVESLNQVNIKDITNAEVLRRLNFTFSKNGGKFPHPNPNIANERKNVPKLFEFFPEVVTYIKKYVTGNLATFSCTMLEKELEKTIIPALIKEAKKTPDYESSTGYLLLQKYDEKPPNYSQVYRWVKYLGFSMDTQKKTYYVDGHERPEQREHRDKLTAKYLAELEPYCHRWIQITEEKYQMLVKEELKDLIIKGHQYEGPNGERMREFHVDDHDKFQEIGNEENPDFGGK